MHILKCSLKKKVINALKASNDQSGFDLMPNWTPKIREKTNQ